MKALTTILCLILAAFVYGQNVGEAHSFIRDTESDIFFVGTIANKVVYVSNKKQQAIKKYSDQSGNKRLQWFTTDDKRRLVLYRPLAVDKFYQLGAFSYSETHKEVCFTASLSSQGDTEPVLELFMAKVRADGSWSTPKPFLKDHCGNDEKLGHPAYSEDGNQLYFVVSNDSLGSDIYVCQRKSDGTGWDFPSKLNSEVNTNSNEYYPYVDRFGDLYFSSNRVDSSGFDIYRYSKGGKLSKLSLPFNSDENDFAYCKVGEEEDIFLSSDRKRRRSDIFKVKATVPNFENCREIQPSAFCYLFEETSGVADQDLPLKYIWNLGDGNKVNGLSVEHCYSDFGQYNVQLDLIDTLSNTLYGTISRLQVLIEPCNVPLIQGPDTLLVGESATYKIDLSESPIQEGDIYWKKENIWKKGRNDIDFSFLNPGIHIIGIGIANGEEKLCNLKTIVVVEEETLVSSIEEDGLGSEKPMSIKRESEMIYFVEFFDSEWEISLSDPLFEEVPYKITERKAADDDYRYSVGENNSPYALYGIYREMKSIGFTDSKVVEAEMNEFKEAIIRQGGYVYDKEKKEMLSFIKNLADVNFAYNSDAILESSLPKLQEVRNILFIDEGFRLYITAHTDNVGGSDFNIDLSERRAAAVQRYLIDVGIEPERIRAMGMGDSKPITSNATEAGKAKNRRVEFRLFFAE